MIVDPRLCLWISFLFNGYYASVNSGNNLDQIPSSNNDSFKDNIILEPRGVLSHDDQVAQDLKEVVKEANLQAAAHADPIIPSTTQTWMSLLYRELGKVWKNVAIAFVKFFYRRRDRLRENVQSDQARENYDRIRQEYIMLTKERYPHDSIVNAIITANDSDLAHLLRISPLPIKKLYNYFEIALMLPSDTALSLLIEQLDLKTSHFPHSLKRFAEIDYAAFLMDLVSPHISAYHFKRLFKAHPPQKPLLFLANVLELMIKSPPEAFLDYLSVSYELAQQVRQSISPIILRFLTQQKISNRPLLNIAFALVFLYLENKQASAKLEPAKELLDSLEIEEAGAKEGLLIILRGFNQVLEVSNALGRMALGSKTWRVRVREIVRLASQYDPKFYFITNNGLSTLLEAAWSVVLTASQAEIKENALLKVINNSLYNAKTNITPTMPLKTIAATLYTGFLPCKHFRSSWSSSIRILIKLADFLALKIPSHMKTLSPCSNASQGQFPITRIALGTALNDKDFAELGYGEAQVMVNMILAHTFRRPPSMFRVDFPTSHLNITARLDLILTSYCKPHHPLVVFEGGTSIMGNSTGSMVQTRMETRQGIAKPKR